MKKLIAFFLSVTLLVGACCTNVLAAESETAQPYASAYLSAYTAQLTSGTKPGEVVLSFYVHAARTDITRIGVLTAVVYRANGTKFRSYSGTYANGLLKANDYSYTYSFHATLTTDTDYYMVVTFVAGNASGADTREFTTNIAHAPA